MKMTDWHPASHAKYILGTWKGRKFMVVENPDFEGDWGKRYLGKTVEDAFGARIEGDIDGYPFYSELTGPDGAAFYVFVDVDAFPSMSRELVKSVIRNTRDATGIHIQHWTQIFQEKGGKS